MMLDEHDEIENFESENEEERSYAIADEGRGYSEDEGSTEQEMYEHYRFVADPGQTIIRVDKFLAVRIEKISRSRVQNAARAGNILVNDIPVKANHKVKPNDVVKVVMSTPPRVIKLIAEEMDLNIVYEDMDIMIVNKPPKLVVHPAFQNYNGTLLNGLRHYIEYTSEQVTPESRALLVHRIDKDTSGLLVVAKNEYAQEKLAKQFFDHSIERKYIALVWGNVKEDEGTVTGHIGRDLKDRTKRAVYPGGEIGKHAVTHYKVIERFGYVTAIECKLETGRTHQIRVHMKHVGHVLFNDGPYGGSKILKGTTFTKYKQFVENCFKVLPRHALHAKSLGFIHPTTNQDMYFESDLPDDMVAGIRKWRNYKQNF